MRRTTVYDKRIKRMLWDIRREKLHLYRPEGGIICNHTAPWTSTDDFLKVTCKTCRKISLRCGVQTTIPFEVSL